MVSRCLRAVCCAPILLMLPIVSARVLGAQTARADSTPRP
jgi:hypothetical protein